MASLNLMEWRTPQLPVVLRRQINGFCLLAVSCMLLVGLYYAQFHRRLNNLKLLQQQQAYALRSYSTLQTQAQTLTSQQQAYTHKVQQQRDHAASLSLFIHLLEITRPAVTINAIDWLTNELKITGEYATTEAIKQLQQTLAALTPDATSSVRFSPPNRFTIQFNFTPQ